MKKAFYISVAFSLAVSISCKKDKNILPADVQDPTDGLNAKYSDTSLMTAHTIYVDSVKSYNDAIKFLGSNQDPVFGRTDVSLYTKMSTDRDNIEFPNATLVTGEIVIAVKSLDFVGDHQCPLTYQVFAMNQNIPASDGSGNSKLYFSKPKNWYSASSKIAERTCTYDVINGTLVVRIPVDQTYAAAMLNNANYLVNNATFQNTYKGFYITTKSTNLNPVSAQGVIAKLDLENPLSGFHLYYQIGELSTSKETKVHTFPFKGTEVVRFNEVKHDYNSGGNNVLTQQLQGDTSKGSQGLFLQGLGGVKVKFQIPHLLNYVKDHKISVNQAEIRFKIDLGVNGTDGKYVPSTRLAIFGMDSTGAELYTYDQLNTLDFARYGGKYDSGTQEYVFNISRDIQRIMNGSKKNYGFYLVLADGDPAFAARRDDRAERVVIGGAGSALYKPVLKLTYTPFDKD